MKFGTHGSEWTRTDQDNFDGDELKDQLGLADLTMHETGSPNNKPQNRLLMTREII